MAGIAVFVSTVITLEGIVTLAGGDETFGDDTRIFGVGTTGLAGGLLTVESAGTCTLLMGTEMVLTTGAGF